MMKVLSMFGTRPEMIKMCTTLKKLDALNFDHVMVHTGQNFTPELKDFFFRDLGLRDPDFYLDIDTSSYGLEVADVIRKSEEILTQVRPDALLILGDTYSGLACMPANHYGVPVYHMEAGLRAFDVRMPEQRNRILIDHMSQVLLPFNAYHRENLIREGIHPSKIFVTVNPTFETIRHLESGIRESAILDDLSLAAGDYVLVTAHRSENVDSPEGLEAIISALGIVAERFGREVIYPIHPRTRSKMAGLDLPKNVRLMNPLGFFDYNRLSMDAFCIISDSGTAPEESLFYRTPCVSLRKTTERPETVEAGAHIVAGLDPEDIAESVETVTSLPWESRYDFEEERSASTAVVNVIRSRITNYF